MNELPQSWRQIIDASPVVWLRMIVTRDDFTPWRLRLIEQLQALARLQIRVGVLGSSDGELLRIAYVQEFGMTITPKRAQNLAIPLRPSMRDKSPRDVPNTWVLESDGNRFIVRNRPPDGIDFLFLLLPRVTIPERFFIRAGYDGNKDLIAAACSRAVKLGHLRAGRRRHRRQPRGRRRRQPD